MHGATLVDADDKVLRPCILWNDTRSYAEAAKLDADARFRAITGNIVFPGFTAPKLAWVKNKRARNLCEGRKVLLPKDYLRLWLTGEHISEMSDSAGTSWLDYRGPPLVISENAGRHGSRRRAHAVCWSRARRKGAACAVSLPANGAWDRASLSLVGQGDNAASACGMGTVAEGHAFVSLGTSACVLFAANASYLPKPESAVHAFCHALPNTWHQMGRHPVCDRRAELACHGDRNIPPAIWLRKWVRC